MERPEPLDESLLRDSVCGLELQLIDAVERQRRAEAQGHLAEVAELQREIDGIHSQLAVTADIVADAQIDPHGP
ncbi:MAG: hypothetical protein ACRDY7_11890 [Acidimicrobiia bacterium]